MHHIFSHCLSGPFLLWTFLWHSWSTPCRRQWSACMRWRSSAHPRMTTASCACSWRCPVSPTTPSSKTGTPARRACTASRRPASWWPSSSRRTVSWARRASRLAATASFSCWSRACCTSAAWSSARARPLTRRSLRARCSWASTCFVAMAATTWTWACSAGCRTCRPASSRAPSSRRCCRSTPTGWWSRPRLPMPTCSRRSSASSRRIRRHRWGDRSPPIRTCHARSTRRSMGCHTGWPGRTSGTGGRGAEVAEEEEEEVGGGRSRPCHNPLPTSSTRAGRGWAAALWWRAQSATASSRSLPRGKEAFGFPKEVV